VVNGFLFIQVIMVLITGVGLCAAQAERLSGVGIIGQQAAAQQVVHTRCVILGDELRFAGSFVLRVGISGEVVVKGNVLLKNNDDVLDRRGRLRVVRVGPRSGPAADGQTHG
jgi:hypothetical protein